MKPFLCILLALLGFLVSSCEEEEVAIRFSLESNSNPESITFEYYSPDPSCMPKYYWINVDERGGELVLKATDASTIWIPDTTASELFSASTKGEVLTLHFEPIDTIDGAYYLYLNVAGSVKNKQKETSIAISRYLR